MTVEGPGEEKLADSDAGFPVCGRLDGMQLYLTGLMALGLLAVMLILFINNL